MVFNQALFDDAEEVIVQAGIDDENDHFRGPIPVSVNSYEAVES